MLSRLSELRTYLVAFLAPKREGNHLWGAEICWKMTRSGALEYDGEENVTCWNIAAFNQPRPPPLAKCLYKTRRYGNLM